MADTEEAKPEEKVEEVEPTQDLKATVDAMRVENDRAEKVAKDLRELQALNLLGGKTDSVAQPEKPQEETPKEYNDRVEKELSEGKHDG